VTARDTDLVGQTIDGKYRIESLLGRGGMGAVFRAVHLGTDRVVALKVIAPSFAEESEYLARFSREARACGRLRHPGIVDVTDFGIANHNGRPLAYLVMEFLDGRTLADALKEQPRPPLPWVIDILEQVCSAVEEAHRQGILHRDLKPENIWLEPNRRGGYTVKVLDFGLAKLGEDYGITKINGLRGLAGFQPPTHAANDENATMEHVTHATIDGTRNAAVSSVSGTPAYMSPEQTRGEPVTARSDVYSLGVIAYRMVAGQLPFEGSVTEILTAQITKEAPPLGSLRPDVHEDAARLIGAALSKNPAERPASAGTFGNMLGAQLEPAGAFFRRAAVLTIDRLALFATIGFLSCAPLLIASTALALWHLGASSVGLPPLSGTATAVALPLLFLLLSVSQIVVGAMPIFVLRAVAEPLRPLEVRDVWRKYAPRLRRWARAMLPFTAGMVALVLSLVLLAAAAAWFGPSIRALPRIVRIALVLPLAVAPFIAAYVILRRKGVGGWNLGLLSAVMLVEDLPFGAAAERSSLLVRQAGGLRNAVQRRYTIASAILSALLGMTMVAGRGGGSLTESILVMMPILSLLLIVVLTLNGVVGALMYLSARRASGESMDQILDAFECR
jgi:serine/threonine protein kinase